jgi:DNA-binding XRE family transcriptional regulator
LKAYKKVTLFLSNETISELEKYASIENNKNLLWKTERENYIQVSDLIRGIVIDYLEQLKSQDAFAGLDDLGKPYRLKNNFKEITKNKNLSQQQISEKTNIEPSNISLIFRNKNQPSLDYFLRIWIALGCPSISDCLYREIAEK